MLLKSLIFEYKPKWVLYRTLYATKLKLLNTFPQLDKLFEKNVAIKSVDFLSFPLDRLEMHYSQLNEGDKKSILYLADQAILGNLFAFSAFYLDYGDPIDWHLHPISGVRVSSRKKWFQIPDFDNSRGDIKTIWEPSRFTHFLHFSRAYVLTKNKKYYEAFSKQLSAWLDKNPYGYGPNHKCGQEATLRMMNVLIAYSVFRDYGMISDKDENNVQELVKRSYKKVLSNFFYAHKCIKNNHTISEITGMMLGAKASDDTKQLKKAFRLLNKEIDKQFTLDGGYIQDSFTYQRFSLQVLEFVLSIENTTEFSINQTNKDKLINSISLLYNHLDKKTNDIPNYGSNDGAFVFPFTTNGYRDFVSSLNSLHVLLTKTKITDNPKYQEEKLWFNSDKEENLSPKPPSTNTKSYPNAGLHVFKNKETMLMAISKKHKTRPGQPHQHHIDLWHKGANVFCDNGSYSYAESNDFKISNTTAHNTIQIDEKEQMRKKGKFFTYGWTKQKDIEFSNNYFRSVMQSVNGYEHKREIKWNNQSFIIDDYVQGKGERCYFYFHTPCEIQEVEDGLLLKENQKPVVKLSGTTDYYFETAYRSLYYLNKEKITRIVFHKPLNFQRAKAQFTITLL